MSLRGQVIGGLVLLLLLSTGLSFYQLLLTRRLHEANRRLAGVELELSRSSLGIGRQLDRLADLSRRYGVLADPAYVDEIRRLRQLVAGEIAEIEELPLADRGPISALRALWDDYVARASVLEEEAGSDREFEARLRDVLEALAELRELVRRLDARAAERAAEVIESSSEGAAAAARAAVFTETLALVLILALVYWVGRSTGGPLRDLTRGAQAMAAGDFEHRVPLSGPTELRALARDFNILARQLGELDQMKRDFLATVSHDLKAPLASIQETMSLLLEEDSGLTSGQRRLVELSTRSAERLRTMISDLLDIARLEGESVVLQREQLELSDCCEEAIVRAAGLLTHKRLEVVRRFGDGPLPVSVDPALFLQALGNLLSNAVNYSPAGATIDLATRSVSDGGGLAVRLELRDRGPGVPDADKERIFDRFYRSTAAADRPAGTGLGLAIARSIIQRHGGRVWVEDAPGRGSVFVVELPRAVPAAPAVFRGEVTG